MRRAGRILFLIVIFIGLTILQARAENVERGEELAGEQEPVLPQPTPGPVIKEPERALTSMEKGRPILKLPEVIVKGERQYRVTGERHDFLLMDPMHGTKEIPGDMAQVAIPGLNDEKEGPAADTLTAKNYLLLIEGGLGTGDWSEGGLVAGLELNHYNLVLRSDYSGMARPQAFDITPFDQKANTNLDIGLTTLPGIRCWLGVTGRGETNRQPENQILGWGDWLERISGSLELGGEFKPSPLAKIKLLVKRDSFYQHGSPQPQAPILKADLTGLKASWEQMIPGIVKEELSLMVDIHYQTQAARLDTPLQNWQADERLWTTSVMGRFKPISLLLLDMGVQLDDLRGIKDKNSSQVIAQLSLLLPLGITLYGSMDGGLHWEPVSEWAYAHSRQSVAWLPASEEIKTHYRLGWRQQWSNNLSSDLAWFKQENRDAMAWVDGNQDGLFNLINLPETEREGFEGDLEIGYTKYLFQKISYVYHTILTAGPVLYIPNLPLQELKTELRLELKDATLSFNYRLLGERYGDPAEKTPSLKTAHLIGMQADFKIAEHLDVYTKLDNLLNDSWDEWKGYPGRGISGLGGVRFTF